jgi:DUF4097 and DUF4098 domain-containing protein YvlB
MIERLVSAALAVVVLVSPAFAQAKKAGNSVIYDVTITADGTPYTGAMTLAVNAGKVTGDIRITAPAEITGKVAGTAKAGQMNLDFPYHMVERNCDGQIAMSFPLPAKKGAAPATGTVDIVSCEGDKLAGTIELKPKSATKKP